VFECDFFKKDEELFRAFLSACSLISSGPQVLTNCITSPGKPTNAIRISLPASTQAQFPPTRGLIRHALSVSPRVSLAGAEDEINNPMDKNLHTRRTHTASSACADQGFAAPEISDFRDRDREPWQT